MRICQICYKQMKEGYCIGGGENYYCSKECLNKEITDEEFKELYSSCEEILVMINALRNSLK